MANIHDAFPSKYLKAGDLKGKQVAATIDSVTSESVGSGAQASVKLVMHFVGKDRGMVLNKTNASVIASAYGPETDNWNNQRVILRAEMVSFQGNMVQGLRIYPAQAGQAPVAAAEPTPPVLQDEPPMPDDDDMVPF